MKNKIVHCRICHQEINKATEKENVDWIMPSNRYYYHVKCYKDWKRIGTDVQAVADQQLWYDSLKEYLAKDLKMNVNYSKLDSQWNNFLKKGKTPKGIYFSVKYFYDITHGDPKKSEGGIGIVQYIYEEAAKYWQTNVAKLNEIAVKIQEQLYNRENQQKKIITAEPQPRSKKKAVSLDVIDAMGDDDVN